MASEISYEQILNNFQNEAVNRSGVLFRAYVISAMLICFCKFRDLSRSDSGISSVKNETTTCIDSMKVCKHIASSKRFCRIAIRSKENMFLYAFVLAILFLIHEGYFSRNPFRKTPKKPEYHY